MTTERKPSVSKHHAVPTQLGNDEPTTVREAAAFLEDIRTSKGYLDDETKLELDKVSPKLRNKVLLMAHERRELEAAFTTSISEQIYSSKYRFLYELIQNADDVAYCIAHSASAQPFLRFEVSPEIVTVETNEDGFTRANIKAICATGKSSKKASAADKYIGEKGFGFKSVFAVADDVHIQSGVWSFRFEHREGGDGLDMVTPIDAEHVMLPSDVTTRITLRLTQTTKEEYHKLIDAFRNMPETTVFFLQRLRKIHIRTTALDGAVVDSIFEKQAVDTSESRVEITHRHISEETPLIDTSLYRCVDHVVKNMPEDKRRKGRRSAFVKLAFPVNPDTQQPKLSKLGQHIFAYLPLQRLQHIQFLIHSDFITSASRESVIECSWNDAILKGVAEAFGTAVQSWVKEDDPLRYSWLGYLPTDHRDGQWGALSDLIQKNLADRPILQTWETRQFKQPRKLCLLQKHMLHKGKPILKDLPDEIYLAPEYDAEHASKLSSLGVSKVHLEAILERLQADLLDVVGSRLRTTEPNDPWHEAFAALFLTWEMSSSDISILRKTLNGLPIIPLQDRSKWASAPGQGPGRQSHIYFSLTDGVAIPNSLGLCLLDEEASLNTRRKPLYKMLGVEECSQELVVAKMKEQHSLLEGLTDSNSHILYLFLTNEDPSSVKPWAFVKTDTGNLVKSSESLYLPSKGAYDMYHLSRGISRKNFELLGNDVVFLDKSLAKLATGLTNKDNVAWKDWLQRATGARTYPPLLHITADENNPSLSPALLAVCDYKPYKFLGMLRAHWKDYENEASRVKGDLMTCRVKIVSKSNYALHKTYLPTKAVVSKTKDFGLSPTDFPILHLDVLTSPTDTLDEMSQRNWRFLEEFGVSSQPDLGFYKHALQKMKSVSRIPDFQAVKMVYISMARCTTGSDQDDLREFFSAELIFFPYTCDWVDIKQCNWHGPGFLRYTKVIAICYGNDPLLKSFFTGTLGLRDTGISDILRELLLRQRASDSTSIACAGKMYAFLNANTTNRNTWKMIKDVFEQNALVLGTSNIWHKLDTCVWQSPFRLSGKEDLSSAYPDLEDFFVKRLKVKKVEIHMLINEISTMVEKENPEYAEVRERLLEIGLILSRGSLNQPARDALDKLAVLKFLPMRVSDGSAVLVDKAAAYAIADHARYANAWAGKGILLDFTVEEVQILNVMFNYFALGHRYLSAMVTESSTIGDEMQEEDTGLSRQLQNKAYALYCCAAKYKSVKALRGDHRLFEQLLTATTVKADLSTELLLRFEESSVGINLDATPTSVKSERTSLQHEIVEDGLKVYIPRDQQQIRTCFRSQLPKLLADFMQIDCTAYHDISVIISSELRDLDDVLAEHDIPCVSWIEKPTLDLGDNVNGVESEYASQRDLGLDGALGQSRASTVEPFSPSDATLTDQTAISSRPTTPTPRRPRPSIDSVVSLTPDHPTSFGERSQEQKQRDKYIGALAEAAVFETLSALHLQNFTRENWKSTIRGCLSDRARYADLRNWVGVETADIVYTDREGILTQRLREMCTGGFPAQIQCDHDFARHPIEYFLEVKGTSGPCDGKFFLSTRQYERMQTMTLREGEIPEKVYVIMRVYNVRADSLQDETVTSGCGMKVFVDPPKLNGRYLRLEFQGWTL